MARSRARNRALGAYSSSRGEPLLDLLHQRMDEACFAQRDKILEDDGIPRFLTLDPLAAPKLKIDLPRLLDAVEEHQSVGAVRMKPRLVRRNGDGPVRRGKGLSISPREKQVPRQAAEGVDVGREPILPLRSREYRETLHEIGNGEVQLFLPIVGPAAPPVGADVFRIQRDRHVVARNS